MIFRRALQRYAQPVEPETPYQRAGQLWDERIGSAREQAKNWRLLSFGTLAMALLLGGGMLWQASQSRVTPYVVQVDKFGAVQAVGPAIQNYSPTDAEIAWYLARFVTDVRSLSLDQHVTFMGFVESAEVSKSLVSTLALILPSIQETFGLVVPEALAMGVPVLVSEVCGARDELLRWARDRDYIYERQVEDEGTQVVRLYNEDTAIVTARLWLKGTHGAEAFDRTLWFSDTYVRTPEGWRYAFGQASIALPADAISR